MNDGTVYYGEVAYATKGDGQLYFNQDEVPHGEEVTQVRQGFGIQLYGRNPEAGDKLCYYAGKWERDQKSGDGSVLLYPDGVSQFVGQFKNNVFNGVGQLSLKCSNDEGTVNGKHTYIGGFRDGKLEGQGAFEHGLTRQTFGPDFSNNYYAASTGADSLSFHNQQHSHSGARPNESMHKVLLDLFNLPSTSSQEDFIHKVNRFRHNTNKAQKDHDERVRVYRIT